LTYPAELRDVSPELDEQVNMILKMLKKNRPDAIPEKRKRDEIYTTLVGKALATKLAQYPTSVEEDEKLLLNEGIGKRRRMAIEVRLGEKRLLQEALALVKDGEGEERAGKKAKRNV
jgi:SET domain-containing protein 6